MDKTQSILGQQLEKATQEEQIDTLIAISVVAKRLAEKLKQEKTD